MTEEQKAAKLAQLAKGRETAKRNREAAAAAAKVAPAPENLKSAEPEAEEEYYPPPVIAEGGMAVEEPEGDPEPVETTPFQRWVLSLDSETRDLLDDSDLVEIWTAQQEKAKAERKAAVKKAASASALQTARIAEGVTSPASAEEIAWKARMAEPVDFVIEMPHVGEGVADIGMRIDQKIYLEGVRYTLPRAQYDSMRYNLWLARQNELLFEGRDRRHWLRRQASGSVDGRIN